MANTLVLGIGNTLLSDEGLGIHLLNYLRSNYPEFPGVTYLDGGTLSFTLAPEIEDCDNLIVLDAAQLDAEPGSILTGRQRLAEVVGVASLVVAGGRRRDHHVLICW